MMTAKEIRMCAVQAERFLLDRGDPLAGDDWAMMQVVRAYLAEHPADDDEPATCSWWESVSGGKVWCDSIAITGGGAGGPVYTLWINDKPFIANPTRGQVRIVCRARGIALRQSEASHAD
jgi:hypothetical protein